MILIQISSRQEICLKLIKEVTSPAPFALRLCFLPSNVRIATMSTVKIASVNGRVSKKLSMIRVRVFKAKKTVQCSAQLQSILRSIDFQTKSCIIEDLNAPITDAKNTWNNQNKLQVQFSFQRNTASITNRLCIILRNATFYK